jgi:hypothetical protein
MHQINQLLQSDSYSFLNFTKLTLLPSKKLACRSFRLLSTDVNIWTRWFAIDALADKCTCSLHYHKKQEVEALHMPSGEVPQFVGTMLPVLPS